MTDLIPGLIIGLVAATALTLDIWWNNKHK